MNHGIEEVTIADMFFRYVPKEKRSYHTDCIQFGQEKGHHWLATIQQVRDFMNDLSEFLADVQRAEE